MRMLCLCFETVERYYKQASHAHVRYYNPVEFLFGLVLFAWRCPSSFLSYMGDYYICQKKKRSSEVVLDVTPPCQLEIHSTHG